MTLPEPLAYYKFNTVGATIPDDAVGGAHPLSVSGAGVSSAAGKVGAGLGLTGSSFNVGRGAIVPAGTTGTVACWLKLDLPLTVASFPTGWHAIWSQDSNIPDPASRLGLEAIPVTTTSVQFTGAAIGSTTAEVDATDWIHLSCYLLAGSWRCKVNGGTSVGLNSLGAFGAGTFDIGVANPFYAGMSGVLDELVVYAETLTEEQQEEIYAIGLAGQSLVEVEMSNITSLSLLRYGKHTSNTQLESDASVSYGFCEHEGDIAIKQGPRKLERNLRRGDNEKYARVVGPRDVPTLGFSTQLRGLNANSGGAVTTAKQTELGPLLDVIMGANGTGGTGSTASASGHSSTTLAVASAASIVAGNAVLFEDTSDGWIAREVVSKSSNTLTLDRAYTGTPVSSGVVYCGVSWYPDQDAPNHVHLAADVENIGLDRVKMFGGMGSVVVDFPANGGLAMCAWSFDFSHDDDDESPASPTFSAPTVGTTIPCIDGTFWVGASELLMRDAKLNITPAKAQKQHYAALNGFAGYVVTAIDVTLTGTLLMGALTSEATQTTRRTLQGASTQDIAFQLGRGPGASIYVRLPAADFDCAKASVDGQDALTFTAMATRSANQANVPGAARIHLF